MQGVREGEAVDSTLLSIGIFLLSVITDAIDDQVKNIMELWMCILLILRSSPYKVVKNFLWSEDNRFSLI